MRRTKAIAALCMLLAVSMMGCVRPDPTFDSPVSSLPKILIDYVDNATKVFVQPMAEHRYANITMRVFRGATNYSKTSENNTYMMYIIIPQKQFVLNVTVLDLKYDKNSDTWKRKTYAFEGNFTVRPAYDPDVVIALTIAYQQGGSNEHDLTEDDLPYQTLADRME